LKNTAKNISEFVKKLDMKQLKKGFVLLLTCFVLFLAVYVGLILCYDGQNTAISISMSVFGILSGIMFGLILLVLLGGVTLSHYFRDKQKNAHLKYAVEVKYIAIVLGICIGIKLLLSVIIFILAAWSSPASSILENLSIGEGMKIVFSSFYSGINRLTFEGLEEFTALDFMGSGAVFAWFDCLFFGASLYAGTMFLAIITAKTSYEILSRIIVISSRERKNNIYIFTALTEETLLIAKSIETQSNKENNMIIFAGEGLADFDKHNTLCREVMSNGFLYLPFIEDIKNPQSMAERLGINNHNIEDYGTVFAIFAFESEDYIPHEERNLDFVISDVNKRIEKGDDMRIEYFIFTKREINYSSYDGVIAELKEKFEEKGRKEFENYFVINAWNGADAIAKSVVQVVDACEKEDPVRKDDIYLWSIGYGLTAQAIAREFFVQTAGLNSNGKVGDYRIDVFDPEIIKVAGLLQLENPLSIYIDPSSAEKKAFDGGVLPDTIRDFCGNDLTKEKSCFASIREGITKKRIATRKAELIEKEVDNILTDMADSFRFFVENPFDENNPKHQMKEKTFNLFVEFLESIDNDSYKTLKKILEKNLEKPIFFGEKDKKIVLDIINRIYAQKNKIIEYYQKEFIPMTVVLNPMCGQEKDFVQIMDNVTGQKSDNSLIDELFNELNNKGLIEKYFGEKFDKESLYPAIPRYIVIAMGDDFANIKLANAIVSDIIKERQPKYDQTILVNIWSEKNNNLINLCGGKKEGNIIEIPMGEDKKLRIFIMGNSEQVYSYNSFYDYSYFAKWNEKNSSISKVVISENKEKTIETERIIKEYIKGKDIDFDKLRSNLEYIKKAVEDNEKTLEKIEIISKHYCKLSLWRRLSSMEAYRFRKAFARELQYYNVNEKEDFCKFYKDMCIVEHQRWMRLHIASGWTFSGDRNDVIKRHDCVVPYPLVKNSTIRYELINIIKSLNSEE